jgi:hypothetical protein
MSCNERKAEQKGEVKMKKTIATILLVAFVILITAGFSFAEYAMGGGENFPYFQLGCLIIGGLIMVSLKQKFQKIYAVEVAGAFALYAVYVALFTMPVMERIKDWIN